MWEGNKLTRPGWTYPIHITLIVLVSTPGEVSCLAIKRWLLL